MITNSSKIDSHKVSYRENKRTSKKNSQENINKTNYAVKHKQLSTEKFIDHCKNYRFIDACRLIHSVDKDNVGVQYYLGFIYKEGRGVAVNEGEAFKWYRKASEQGHLDAQYELGSLYCKKLGSLYCEKDAKEMFEWFHKSAIQGNVKAQYMLGFLYDSGFGVARNVYEAVRWYRMAAEQGDTAAKEQLQILGH